MKGLKCLLVIPSYQDGARLAPYLRELARGLPADFAVQVVDDGSGGDEILILEEMIAKLAGELSECSLESATFLAPLALPVNCGKGAAVRHGWENCRHYEFAGFVDADGAIPVPEIVRGYRYLVENAGSIDGILGSRVQMLGRQIERNLLRHITGRIFATAVAYLTGVPIYDSQCGFKLFKSSRLAPLLPELKSSRYSFDVELVVSMLACGAAIHEFPIDWFDKAGSKVRLSRDALPMLIDVWQTSRRVRLSKRNRQSQLS